MTDAKRNKLMMAGGIAAAGIASIYFLDPERGQERRIALSRKSKRVSSELGKTASKATRDMWHHVKGVTRQAWSHLDHGHWPDDRVLAERIRSRIGRIVAHPHKVHVISDDGVVTLWGPVSQEESRRLATIARTMPGVREVINHLELREGGEPTIAEPNLFRRARQKTVLNWSPFERLLAAAAGTAACIYGLKRKDPMGLSISLLGTGLAATSMLKRNVHSLLAFSEDSPGFELEQTIRINAPVSDVYDFWVNPENYPKAFSHVSKVEKIGENLYRWTINGPGGIPVHWEGMITRTIPNTIVEWKSMPGSTVANLGFVRVDPNYDASTRVLVRMFYRPPAGILGRFIAEMLDADPKVILDHDLKRLKMLFEKEEAYMKELNKGAEHELLKIART